MINFLICVILSVMVACGMSIALVEKSDTWPLKKPRILLQLLLRKIHWKLPRMLFCNVCSVFWLTFFSDIIIFIITSLFLNVFYFFWPFSGFISLGIMWFINEYLNSREQHIEIINNIPIREKENE